MRRAAIYMRVSTAGQEKEETIDNQLMELEKAIKENGDLLLPECVYKDEGWSGAILERPDLDRMRSDARQHKFEVLYFYDRGRIARKQLYQALVLVELKELDIKFIGLHDINGDSDEDWIMGNIMGLFYEYERVKIAERMRLGKVRKVRENKKLLGYQPKFGYDYHPRIKTGSDARDGFFTVNKKNAAVVKQIYGWKAAGISKHEIKRKLYEHGIMPPKGKREIWSSGTLDRLLRDTTYIGDHFYNKSESVPTKNPQNPEQRYRKVLKGSRKARPKEEWMLIKVPAIISKELFDKVQVQLELDKKINPRNNSKNFYLLNGIVECVCGRARTGEQANYRNLYYRCTDHLSHFPAPRECYEHGVNAPVLDALVWTQLEKLLTNPDNIKKQAERWLTTSSPLVGQSKSLQASLDVLDEEERRYSKAYGSGVMSERLYKEHVGNIKEHRLQLEQELANIDEQTAQTPVLPLEKLVDSATELLRNLDLTDKKAIIRRFIKKVVATKKEAIIWGQLPILAKEQVGLNAQYRDCGTAERRQEHPV